MTTVKYLGPSASIKVHPYGDHAQGQEKEYPDDFAAVLLATSKKQRFEIVDASTSSATDSIPEPVEGRHVETKTAAPAKPVKKGSKKD